MSEQKKLVEVQHLQQYVTAGGFGTKRRYLQPVDDVRVLLNKGETLGPLGYSGHAKTTHGRTPPRPT